VPVETCAARRRRTAGWLAAALFALPLGARAQGLTFGAAAGKEPVAISAASGIEWQQDAKAYIARGHAAARRGPTRVDADTLVAHYRQSKGGNEIYRIDADGHVVIRGPTQTIVGDHAVYDADQQVAVVTGKRLQLTTATDRVAARDSFEWYEQKQVAVARGDAVAVRGDKQIRADVLTAYLSKGGSAAGAGGGARAARTTSRATQARDRSLSSGRAARGPGGSRAMPPRGAGDALGTEASRIERIDAQGNVIVSTATDIARGDYGVYDAKTGIVTLLGKVTITRGEDALRGQYAVVDLNRNVSRIMSLATQPGGRAPRVEGIFVRQSATPLAGAAPGGRHR
jgi:lipopolysaccharide export system protein LptA